MAPLGPPPPLCPWEYQPPQNLWAPLLHLPGFPGSIPQHPKAPGHSSHLPSHSEPLGPPAPSQGPSPISQLPPKPQTTPSSSLRTPHPAATPHSGLGGKHTTHMLGSCSDRQKSPPPFWTPIPDPLLPQTPGAAAAGSGDHHVLRAAPRRAEPLRRGAGGYWGGGPWGWAQRGVWGVSGTGEHVVDAPDPPTLHLPFPAALSANRCSLCCPTQLLARPPRLLCVGGPRAAALL